MEHNDNRFSKLIDQPAQNFHDLDRVLHIKVIERLIKQNIIRILRNDHGNERTLLLPA
ncbi:Uncharacterised protein [Mycobacteroides abscessus subsp. abscessus]|nr:Uncharacterised protein [Mycobacteroides abscessus subsp. abscessus]